VVDQWQLEKLALVTGKADVLFYVPGLPRQYHASLWGKAYATPEAAVSALTSSLPPNAHIALIPEGRQLWPGMSVEDNLKMGAFPPALRPRVIPNLEGVYGMFPRLKERRHQLAGTLSGGEQQMCAIGRGLMAEPHLLLLDEPSLGLAPILVDEIFKFVGEIVKHGVTILLVAQNIDYALEVSDYGYVMETGHIVLQGTSDMLVHDPHVQEAYLGGGTEEPGAQPESQPAQG